MINFKKVGLVDLKNYDKTFLEPIPNGAVDVAFICTFPCIPQDPTEGVSNPNPGRTPS